MSAPCISRYLENVIFLVLNTEQKRIRKWECSINISAVNWAFFLDALDL